MRFTEYCYYRRLEQRRNRAHRLAASRTWRAAGDRRSLPEQTRLREAPGVEDVRQGLALNSLLDELTSTPDRMAMAAAELANVPCSRDVVALPFRYRDGVLRTYFPNLWDVDGWPLQLPDSQFSFERRNYVSALRTAEEMDVAGRLTPDYVRFLRTAVDALRPSHARNRWADDRQAEARVFFQGLAFLLDRIAADHNFNALARAAFRSYWMGREPNLADFFEFVDAFDLAFLPAERQEHVRFYYEFTRVLMKVRNAVLLDRPYAPVM